MRRLLAIAALGAVFVTAAVAATPPTTPSRRLTTDFSVPYMRSDEAVLLSRSVPGATPRSLAGIRGLRICALSKSTGADAVTGRIKPTKPVRLIGNVPTLLLDLQTGKCDAVVYDSPVLATLKARAPLRYGTLLGVIATGEQYGIALPKGSTLRPAVDTALTSMIEDGTIARLQRKWLTAGIDKLPVLR